MSLPPPWSGSFGRPDTTALTGLPLPGIFKNRLREKRWCYAGIVAPGLFFGTAIVHLGYITSAFCFAFDRAGKTMAEKTFVRLPTGQTRYDRNPETGTCRFRARGNRIDISGNLATGKSISVDVDAGNTLLKARISLSACRDSIAPMHFPMDIGQGRNAFTTKAAGIPAKGSVRIGQREIRLDPENSFALFDWTHGAYPRKTFWNWACGAGSARETTGGGTKEVVGFNLSRGVYENGTLENTLWTGGRPEAVGTVVFEYDAVRPMAPWKINSRDGKIRLVFLPEGMRRANDDFGIVASRFIQPCGRFEGEVTTADGRTFILENTGGVAEAHDARW